MCASIHIPLILNIINSYNQARKVAYNPFPFPHSQLTTLFTLVMLIIVPILLLSFIHNLIVAIIFNELIVSILVGKSIYIRNLYCMKTDYPKLICIHFFQKDYMLSPGSLKIHFSMHQTIFH